MKLDPRIAISGKINARGLAHKVVVARYREAIRQVARVDLEVVPDGEAPPSSKTQGAVRSTHEFDLALDVPHAQTGAHRNCPEKEQRAAPQTDRQLELAASG